MTQRIQCATAHADLQHGASAGRREITVYWRPGCPFCSSLRHRLHRSDLPFREVNIWDDPNAAAFVRSVAGGNETVPTVSVGDVHLVNPSARTVLEVAANGVPGLLTSPLPTQRSHWRHWFGRRRNAP